MHELAFDIVDETDLSPIQLGAKKSLEQECFGDVDAQEIEENFIAAPFGRIFALYRGVIVGMLSLYLREVKFDGKSILVGGLGGVCVTKPERSKGVATEMLYEGLAILKEMGCDVACLNVDLEKKLYGLYEKVGFVMMKRNISYENIHGEIVRELGTMFRPIGSQKLFDLIMHSSSTFHYGRGYW